MMYLRAISFCGLFVMVGLAWLMSSHKRVINIRVIVVGILLQFVLAILMLRTTPGVELFNAINYGFELLQTFVDVGTRFVFGIDRSFETKTVADRFFRSFAFAVIPTIIVFASLMSVLYYLGIMQYIVEGLAWVMQRAMGVSGAESLSTAANIFVGQTEAPLVIRPYLNSLTLSELHAVMVGGFATIAGGVMAAYVGMGVNAGHLVTASVIAAPATLLIAKVIVPETEKPVTMGSVRVEPPQQGQNVIEAAAIGAADGMKLAINVVAMLIAFLALIELLNALVVGLGWLLMFRDESGHSTWSLASAFGYLFSPIAFLMGIESSDCLRAGELLGIKTVANEFVAYRKLGDWMAPESTVKLSARTVTLITYALCGFANFGSIGIQIAGIGGLAPERQPDLARLGLRAMLGGALANCMTACVVGVVM
jgi:CNT family concentrative nucleoside transporter